VKNKNQEKTPTWLRVVAILAIAWNFIGLVAFFMQIKMSEATLAAMSATDRAIYENTPIWATIGFAIAVFAGTFGSVGLFLRKKWAHPVFMVSLIGIIVQQSYFFFGSETMKFCIFILLVKTNICQHVVIDFIHHKI